MGQLKNAGPKGLNSEGDDGRVGFLLLLAYVLALTILLAACATKPAIAPEPRVVTVEVPRIVEVRCKDQRPDAPDFPDDDQKLSSIPDDDFFTLAKVYRAARDLYRARLAVDDVQIKGCAAEQ